MRKAILEIKRKAEPALKTSGVIRFALFGSFARGEENSKSDLDFLVEFPKNKSLLDFIHLKLKLEDVFNRKVDLVDYASIKPLIREEILGSQISIL